MLKKDEVNKKLQELEIPFELKMGVLGEFELKFSILRATLESIKIKNFILFVKTRFSDNQSEGFTLSAADQRVDFIF